MPQATLVTQPPEPILRWMLRAPVMLYRLHLGWLLGERFVLLNHVGRKTGQIHQTVVEVIEHNLDTGRYYVASGWGYRSNWYQNLLSTPTTTIQVGHRRLRVEAETISSEMGAQVLLNYQVRHPVAARELSRLTGLPLMVSSKEELAVIIRETLPIIAFNPISNIA